MLTLLPKQAPSLTDLAAGLTDQALEIVRVTAARGVSVETELKLWHTLTAELRREQNERHFIPLDGALKRVVNRAALRVIAERLPSSDSQTLRSDRPTASLCHA